MKNIKTLMQWLLVVISLAGSSYSQFAKPVSVQKNPGKSLPKPKLPLSRPTRIIPIPPAQKLAYVNQLLKEQRKTMAKSLGAPITLTVDNPTNQSGALMYSFPEVVEYGGPGSGTVTFTPGGTSLLGVWLVGLPTGSYLVDIVVENVESGENEFFIATDYEHDAVKYSNVPSNQFIHVGALVNITNTGNRTLLQVGGKKDWTFQSIELTPIN